MSRLCNGLAGMYTAVTQYNTMGNIVMCLSMWIPNTPPPPARLVIACQNIQPTMNLQRQNAFQNIYISTILMSELC